MTQHTPELAHWNGSLSCGCHMTKGIGKSGPAVQFCPLHAHAHQMKDWLTAALIRLGDEPDFAPAYALLAAIQKGA